MKTLRSLRGVTDAYSRRVLSNLIGRDPFLVYRSTPGELRKLLRGLSPQQLRARPLLPPSGGRAGRRGWSISQLVSHFCDAEWAMGFRIRMALAQPGRPFQAYDQDAWAEKLHYDRADCREKLDLFSALRKSHLSLLGPLTAREWRRYGIHEERGRESVERMMLLLAGHDLNHLRQVRQIRRDLLAAKRKAPVRS